MVEKTNINIDTRIFNADYIPGIFDAVWWAAAVIIGYGDEAPATPCGRMWGIVGMIGGASFLALFTAILSSALTEARLVTASYKRDTLTAAGVDGSTKVCTPSSAYPNEYDVLKAADTYVAPDNSLSTCLRDLEDGKCEIVVYDEPTLRAARKANSTMLDMFMAIPGEDILVLASAFSNEVVTNKEGTFEQAVVTLHNEALELVPDYFPESG